VGGNEAPRHEGVKMRISTDELTWDAKSLTFTGEASELERKIPTGDPGEIAGKLVGGDKILFNPSSDTTSTGINLN
jgi:hypothetical protein